ncbi:MAG: hypothetical protein J0H01_38480 [Rhizobiales bacterium]|nr:hypothetical protein [Hyphomicrobiales bacterium]
METFDWLARQIDTAAVEWSMGAFGAIEGLRRHPDDAGADTRDADGVTAATRSGGIRLNAVDTMIPVAFELLSSDPHLWNHAVALCLPREASRMSSRGAITELGPDIGAIRAEDRGGTLFDIGLAVDQADICLRTADTELIRALRAAGATSLLAAGSAVLDALRRSIHHRVVLTRLGRLEVFPTCPAAPGTGLDELLPGLMPQLLGRGITHARTSPIPAGLVPCAYLFPPHPARHAPGSAKAFDLAQHRAFQAILQRFGRPELNALKAAVNAALDRGDPPDRFVPPPGRWAKASLRVTLRQRRMTGGSGDLDAWRAAFDRTEGRSDDG